MRKFGIAMFIAAVAMVWSSDAYAGGYGSIGSAWYVNTYTHSMSFMAPSTDVKNDTVLFISRTAWYDNLAVCENNGTKFTFVPGGGQTDPLGVINPDPLQVPVTTTDCTKNGGNSACTDSVTYYSKLSEIQDLYTNNPGQIPLACADLDAYGCFLTLLDLPLDYQCQNQNGTLIQVVTKGVCALVTARKCDQKGCADEASTYYRFTYPSFNQPENALFTATEDPTCATFLPPTP